MKKLLFPLLILIAAVLVEGCSSGKQAYERGNYDEAVLKAIHRLRKNPNSNKAAQTLRDSYPLTVSWHRDNIDRAKNSNYEFKWEQVVKEYQQINYLYNELSRCPACMRIVPNAVSYQSELNNAIDQAVVIRYEKGEQILARVRENHDRYEAREAFQHFEVVTRLKGDYRDVRDKIEEARWLATFKIVVEPIPVHSRNLQISNEFFENKILEFVQSMPVNKFVRFYSFIEAKNIGLTQPDQIIQLQFDDFVLGQVYMKEKELHLRKDSVVLAVIKAQNQVEMSDALASNASGVDILRYQETKPVLESPLKLEDSGKGKKVTICHKIPGSLGTSTTITVSENALQHHLDHGDVQGPCQGDEDPQKKPKQHHDDDDDNDGDENEDGNNDDDDGGDDNNDHQQNHQQNQGSHQQQNSGTSGNTNQSNTGGSNDTNQQNNDSGSGSDSGSGQHNSGTTNTGGGNQNSGNSLGSNSNSGGTSSGGGTGETSEPEGPKTHKVYGTVKATMHVFTKTLTSKGLLDFKIIDFHTKRVLTQEKMPGEFVWYTEWGYFNGDERALDDYFIEISKLKEAYPPSPQDLFVAFTQPIYGQITRKIQDFYRNY